MSWFFCGCAPACSALIEASVDHALDDAVVRRQRHRDTTADAIEARVADVRPERARAIEVNPEHDDGGVHPRCAMHVLLRRKDLLVGRQDGAGQHARTELRAFVAERRLERVDGALGRLGAAAVPAGAVGEDGDPARAVAADADLVLVGLALPELAAPGDGEVERRAHFGAAEATAFSRRSRSSCCS